ncbi:S-adenosylmethionine:tRNA ribosyltransferase-isomerase [Alistipes ihumii]|uniref:S-adenosylmethionine:tRNA ribosyltransferase-isomerase n=1 Tax=Alistipes ihumii TaxID=1470347 RepID=UPI00266C9758|nr:S-adenosylmethionine:tRNA ribosyltransferase-isomerase [Alistipes ihumii]
MERNIRISDYDYPLPEGRIAKFPLERREQSKLLVCRDGRIAEDRFERIGRFLPEGSMLVFNNTKVIRARLIFHKATGARIEIFCLEPHVPADYERAFAAHDRCRWQCIVGNLKKWKDGPLQIAFGLGGRTYRLEATRTGDGGGHQIVEFVWDAPLAFGQLLEELGRIPIPPYLCRESEELDNSRYQTVYSRFEGSVAAPTAGLHFTPEVIGRLRAEGHPTAEVTLHVGAGTFLPVKAGNAAEHPMHTEHFEITLDALQGILEHIDRITAVGTTSMRTLESLAALGCRVLLDGTPDERRSVGQWEIYDMPERIGGRESLEALAGYMGHARLQKLKASTQIMIVPGYRFRVASSLITNFHQPQSTLLLLVSAFIGERWKEVYDYALAHDFRFLSYGDSSLLFRQNGQ